MSKKLFKSILSLFLAIILTITYSIPSLAYENPTKEKPTNQKQIINFESQKNIEKFETARIELKNGTTRNPAAIIEYIIYLIHMYGPQIEMFLMKIGNSLTTLPFIPIMTKVEILREHWDKFVDFMNDEFGIEI